MKKLYMAYYRGNNPVSFPARENKQDAIADCADHAKNNPRKRGNYLIFLGWQDHPGTFSTDYRSVLFAEKHGSNVSTFQFMNA